MSRIHYTRDLAGISSQILRLFPLILTLFVVFTINRLIFYFLFSDSTQEVNGLIEIMQGYFLGMRYDSATIMYGLAIPIFLFYLGLLIPFEKYGFFSRIISKIWLTLIFCLFIFIFIIDVYFYEFYQDHLNIIFFDMFQDDTQAVLHSIWKNYPLIPIFIGLIIFGYVIYYFLGKVFYQTNEDSDKFIKNGGILLGSFIVFSMMARASFGLFPINMMDAAYTDDAFLNKLAPNPVFTFEKAIESRIAQKNAIPFWRRNKYKNEIVTAFSKTAEHFLELDERTDDFHNSSLDYFNRKTKVNKKLRVNPPHIVVVIMEGFGSWILDLESDEFQISCGVSDWMEKSINFDHFIQSGFGSIQNLTATLLSVPPIPHKTPISQQKYSIIPFESALAKTYRQNGYETTFVYGGKLSWQRIGDFVPRQGFDHVYGEGDFDSQTPKTDWGVYDEYLFQFVYDILINSNTPQFILFFTTTNHPPFELPSSFAPPQLIMGESLKNMIRGNEDLAQKRFGAYQYSSCYLNQFLNDVYNTDFLKNTVTAVTADHNLQGIRNYSERELLQKYRVPFFIIGPTEIIENPKIISTFGSHVDIAPILIELTLHNTSYLSFGKNLLSSQNVCSVVNQNGIIISPEYVLNYNYSGQQTRGFYKWESPKRWLMNRINEKNLEMNLLDIMTAYYSTASYFLDEEWNKKSKFLTMKTKNN